VPYGGGVTEKYQVNVWIVREDEAPAPDLLRYSVRSWRQGAIAINGVDALIAVMDGDNNALFSKSDTWSAMAARRAERREGRPHHQRSAATNRLMFLKSGNKEVALELKGISADGRFVDVAVIDAKVTKAEDRAPDDMVREERVRPRTDTPVVWGHGAPGFDAALARAKTERKLVIIDFEATWCGPCHTMDEWSGTTPTWPPACVRGSWA
jgi:hypothetical protein